MRSPDTNNDVHNSGYHFHDLLSLFTTSTDPLSFHTGPRHMYM